LLKHLDSVVVHCVCDVDVARAVQRHSRGVVETLRAERMTSDISDGDVDRQRVPVFNIGVIGQEARG
jgi:hypothetical protein